MGEIHLAPGWFLRDVEKATARVAEWEGNSAMTSAPATPLTKEERWKIENDAIPDHPRWMAEDVLDLIKAVGSIGASHDAADALLLQKDERIKELEARYEPEHSTGDEPEYSRADLHELDAIVCGGAENAAKRPALCDLMAWAQKMVAQKQAAIEALEPFKEEAARWDALGSTDNRLPSLWIRHASGTWADPPGAEALFDIDDLRRAARAHAMLTKGE